jgi:hypothetical protein
MKQSLFSIAYTKKFVVKSQFNSHFDSKSYFILLNSAIHLWDVSISKYRMW